MNNTILVLINNAVFAKFFLNVALALRDSGENVILICDSKYTYEKFEIGKYKFETKVFTEYFKIYLDSDVFSEANIINEQWLCHSDFDRARYTGFNYGKSATYWDRYNRSLTYFFEDIFQSKSVSAVIYENVSNAFAYSAYNACKKYSAKYLGLTASRLPGYALFSSLDSELAIKLAKSNTDSISIEEKEFIHTYINNILTITPDYMKTNGLSKPDFIKKILAKRNFSTIKSAVKYSFNGSSFFDVQNGNPLLKSFYSHRRNLVRAIRTKFIQKFYSNEFKGKNYIVYPLHYHPESSTSILANYYDELNLIKNIAFSLPSGKFLVVKDHISAYGFNSIDFYRTVAALPNVYIANPHVNSKELVKSSIGVMTLTSTMGYEAIILHKPVVVFGNVFYENYPNVFKASGYRSISEGLNFIFNNDFTDNKENISIFILSYLRSCFKFNMNYKADEGVLKKDAKYISIKIIQAVNDGC